MSSIMKGIVDETDKIKGADGKACWDGYRYAGTKKGKDKCVPVKNEAANPAQQAAIAISKKERGEKPKHVDEAKAKPYVKPYMENGKQVGWKSSDGYHVKYWRLADSAKAKAYQHAKISPEEDGELIKEAKMSDVVKPLVKAFNLDNGAEERWSHAYPLGPSSGSAKRWRRGDGSYYTDLSKIVALSDQDKSMQKEFFGWLLQQPGVQPAGKIRGEFRSDDYSDAVKYKGLIFINRGAYTEFTTPSRLRNSSVWHQKTDEDYTGQFAAEKTPPTNPYGGLKDEQFRGTIGEASAKYMVRSKDGVDKDVQVEEEQLDEKCWDDYKQVGMKNKGGKSVPNCVPKESAIMKGVNGRLI